MKTKKELLEYLSGLEAQDVSEAVAIGELFRRADEGGRAERGVWVASVRDAYQKLHMPMVRDSLAMPPHGGEALGQYLQEQAVARFERASIAAREPADESWEHLAFDPDLWAAVSGDRDAVVQEVDDIVRNLQERKLSTPPSGAREAVVGNGSLLRAENLTKVYRKRKVVNEVDIFVRQGEIVGLLGPNGAGKTTTFYMMVGLIPALTGQVFLDEEELTDIPMFRRARLGVGYLAQEPSVFRKLTVEQNVMAILETLELSRSERRTRLEDLLQELSIEHLRGNKAYSLSGGERRRLEITRALVQRPKFMLLDEPFAGIDPIAVNDIQQIVSSLKHRGIGVIITDHNVEQTLEIVDRAYIMYEGRIRVSGTVTELVWNDEVAEIYLGPTLTQRMRNRFPPPEGRA